MNDDLMRVIAEVRLRQYDSEYNASHLTWEDFTGEAQEIVAALAPLIEARVREAREAGSRVHWQYGVEKRLPQWNNGEPYIEWGAFVGHDGYRFEHTAANASHRRQVRTWPTEYGEAEEVRRARWEDVDVD